MISTESYAPGLGEPIPKNFFIKYPEGIRIVNQILWLVKDVNPHRPQGCLMVSSANNGKSFLLKYALKQILDSCRQDRENAKVSNEIEGNSLKVVEPKGEVPVVYVRAPIKANHKSFLHDIAKKLGLVTAEKASIEKLQTQVRNGAIKAKTRVIAIDEFQHLVTGGYMGQRVLVDEVKVMSDELGIPFVTAGTEQALHVIASDDQYLSRLRPIDLPRWGYNNDFLALLQKFEREMGVEEGTFQGKDETREIFLLSKGLIGGVAETLNEALRVAQTCNAERITIKHLRQCGKQYRVMGNNQ